MRARRLLAGAGTALAVAAGLVVGALPAGPASASVPAAATTVAGTGVRLELEQLGPTAVRPSDRVVARVRVVNDSPTALDGARVRFFVNSPVLPDRASVQAWADGKGVQGGDRFTGVTGAEQALSAPVPAGGSVEATITVRADQLRLSSAWGPRGVTVDVLDSSLQRVADVRTFLVWTPSGAPSQSTSLTLLSALSGGAPDPATGQLPGDRVAQLTAPGGRLARVLAATAGSPAALALDPALLGGGTGSAPSDVDAWLDSLRGAAGTQELLALPQDDPDAVALAASSGGASLYRLAEAQGAARVQSALRVPAATDVAWPAGTGADGDLLDLLQGHRSAVVLPSNGLGGATPATRGGSVPARITLAGNDDGRPAVVGLVYDATMSATLAAGSTAAAVATAAGAPGSDGASTTPAGAVARLLADSAVTARTGGSSAALLLTTPRDWNPDPVTATAEIGALRTAPWVRPLPLSGLRAADPAAAVRLPEHTASPPGALAADGISRAAADLQRAQSLSSMLSDPSGELSDLQASAVASTSVAWRADPAGWSEHLRALDQGVAALAGGVQVVKGSSVTVISSRVSLPLTLRNTLKQQVRVTVQLKPSDLRLRAEGGPRTVTIGAGSQRAVTMPVRALASGDTHLAIVVTTPTGEAVGTPIQLSVRVRADWEGRGVAAAAVVLALVLVIGFVRTARRVRRRPAPGPGAGPSSRSGPQPGPDPADSPADQRAGAPGAVGVPTDPAGPPASAGPPTGGSTTTGSRRAARAAEQQREPAGRSRRG